MISERAQAAILVALETGHTDDPISDAILNLEFIYEQALEDSHAPGSTVKFTIGELVFIEAIKDRIEKWEERYVRNLSS